MLGVRRVPAVQCARQVTWIAGPRQLCLRAEGNGPGMTDILNGRTEEVGVGCRRRGATKDKAVVAALIVELHARTEIRRDVVGQTRIELERAARVSMAECVL